MSFGNHHQEEDYPKKKAHLALPCSYLLLHHKAAGRTHKRSHCSISCSQLQTRCMGTSCEHNYILPEKHQLLKHQIQPEAQKLRTKGLDEATGMTTACPCSNNSVAASETKNKERNSQILMVHCHQQLPVKSSSKAGHLHNDIK